MKKKYTLSKEQFEKILKINKEGGVPVMYLSGGISTSKSLQEKRKKDFKQQTLFNAYN